MYSRNGLDIDRKDIWKDVIILIDKLSDKYENITFDGELYIHGETLNKISSMVRGNSSDYSEL